MPVNQTIQFDSVSLREIGSGVITAELFQGSVSQGTLASISEDATRNGRYTGTVTDKPAGDYDLAVRFNGFTLSDAGYSVTLLLAAGVYVAANPVAGGLSPSQVSQLNRVEAQTSKLSGSPVTVNGNVKPGGQIVLKQGDNHLFSLLNPVAVPVDDVGGSLHALMAAVGVNNIGVAAIRGADPASRISGTVAALNYASNILTVTMEFTAAETAKGVVGPVYTYDVYRLDNPTRTYFSGKLTVTRDARP